MTPKEIVQSAFEGQVSPILASHGFGYVRSQFAFKRKIDAFTQTISVTLSHMNTSDHIQFWSAFNVTSPRYNSWRKTQGLDRFEGHLGGCMDWNIPGWRPEGDHSTSFNFSEPGLRPRVLKDWVDRCLAAGIPFLDSLSSWEGLGNDLLRWRWHWGRAADFFVIADRPDKAVSALRAGIENLEAQDFSYSENAHPILRTKKKRQGAERDEEVASYRKRINELTNSEQGGAGQPATRSQSE
jgi:hypothetical protein